MPKWVRAAQLRARGLSYSEVAKKSGYSHRGSAYKAVQKAYALVTPEANEATLRLYLDRLDRLQAAFWDRAEAGDLEALMVILEIMKRRAKVLGLDRPMRFEKRLKIIYGEDVEK
jgi:hypothetical protein